MRRIILCLLAVSILAVPSAYALKVGLLHGVDYPPANERWFGEARSFGAVLSFWPDWWPAAAPGNGVRFGAAGGAARRFTAHGDFGALPAMIPGDFFLYYFTGHGRFTPWAPPPETRPPALNRDCEEHIVFNLPIPGDPPGDDLRDDEVTSLIEGNILPGVRVFAIFNSCYAGGMYNGSDPAANAGDPLLPFPPPPVIFGDINDVVPLRPVAVLAVVDENSPAPGGGAFNELMEEAVWPVFNPVTLRFEPHGDANGDGALTVGEFIAYVEGPLKCKPAPRFDEKDNDCPPMGPFRRGEYAGAVPNPDHESSGSSIDSVILVSSISPDSVFDSDGDSLTDQQEEAIGTLPNDPDSDNDGLDDFEEIFEYQTDPLLWDTDGGGVSDGDEIEAGTNPFDPRDDTVPVPAITGWGLMALVLLLVLLTWVVLRRRKTLLSRQ